MKKKQKKKANVDPEQIKQWSKSSTKVRLAWLEEAFRFGKLRKF